MNRSWMLIAGVVLALLLVGVALWRGDGEADSVDGEANSVVGERNSAVGEADSAVVEWKLPLTPGTKKKQVEAALGVDFDKDDCRTVSFYDVQEGGRWALRDAGYALRVRRSMGEKWGTCDPTGRRNKSKVTLKFRGSGSAVARADAALRGAAEAEGRGCSTGDVRCKREVDREVGADGVPSVSLTQERESVQAMTGVALAAEAPGLSSLGGGGLAPVCAEDVVETTWTADWARGGEVVELDLTRWEDARGAELVREVSFRGREEDAEALAAALAHLRGPSGSKTARFYACRHVGSGG